MSFLLIPKTDIYYPSNVSDIYMNRNVTDINLNWNGIFSLKMTLTLLFTTHLTLGLCLCRFKPIHCCLLLFLLIFKYILITLFPSFWLRSSQMYSISPISALSQSSISTCLSKHSVCEHTLSTLFDFILHYPRFPKGSLRLPNIVQRLHAVPRACKQFYKLAVPWVC